MHAYYNIYPLIRVIEINGIVYLYNAKSMLLIELGNKKELYYKNSGQIKKISISKVRKKSNNRKRGIY